MLLFFLWASGTGSCQKIMGVGLCTYDATATAAVETMTTQAVFDEGLSFTKQRVSVGSFTWLHHDRFMFFSGSICALFFICRLLRVVSKIYPTRHRMDENHSSFSHLFIPCTKMCTTHFTMLQVAVATNPTHYGNPSTGCKSDEQALRVQGLSGYSCSPKCDSTGSCPSDVPTGDTATPECALHSTTGDKYCALICQSDSDCGSQVAFQMFV